MELPSVPNAPAIKHRTHKNHPSFISDVSTNHGSSRRSTSFSFVVPLLTPQSLACVYGNCLTMVAITSHHSSLSHLLITSQFHRIAGKGKDLSIKLLDGGSGSALGWCKRAVFFSFLGSYIDALIRSTKVPFK